MKLRYILIALVALTATACEDFLDPKSPSTFDKNYIFSNYEDARRGVNAIYVHFSHDGFRSRLSNNMTGNTDIEHSSGWNSSSARYQIWDLRALENNGDLEYVWSIAYKAIRDANISIEGILASSALNSNDVELSRNMYHLLGEAYTLRAYWYSMLTFYFGDVPFITQAPVAGVEFNVARTDRNEILTSVIQDMIGIEDKMMWADALPYGIEQVNREYTLGMIARLALQRGGYFLTSDMVMEREADYLDYYEIANDYTAKLIELKDRDLPEDFKQIFMNECTFQTPVNEDILFEVPFAVGEGDVAWNIGIRVDAGSHAYGSGSNYMAIPPTYYYSFDTLDKRLDVTCSLYMINSSFTKELVATGNMNISQGKWSRAWLPTPPGSSTNKGTGINWPMLRYSDILLMHAEAENEINGPTATAQAMLRRVRQRAFNEENWPEKVDQYVATAAASKASFLDAIVDERGWEFGGEMIRKYELIRWNIYSTKMDETVAGLKQMTDDALAGTGSLPDYLYVKLDASGNFMVYNKFRKVLSDPADGTWTRKAWLVDMYNTTTSTYDEWITKDWANYTDPVPYIMPTPSTAIINSKGVLENKGYHFDLYLY